MSVGLVRNVAYFIAATCASYNAQGVAPPEFIAIMLAVAVAYMAGALQ